MHILELYEYHPKGVVAETLAKLTTKQFKESPKTSRANTPTSGFMKFDTTDIETNDNKHDEMSGLSAVTVEETTEDEDEQPRDLRYRSINNIMSALHRAQVSDVASRAAIAAMIRGPGSAVTPGMPFHSISSVNSSNAAGTTNVSAQLPLMHAHQPLLNFPPPSPTRSFGSTIMPPTRVEVTTTGGSSVVTVVSSTNSSNINSSVSITPTTSISVAGSSGTGTGAGTGSGSGGGGPTWGGAYTCDRCGNSYARPHSLNRHVRFECGVEPKFECPICHKKSKHKHNLVLHMRTHQHR